MSAKRNAVFAAKAPKPNGNCSHVVRAQGLLFIAGWMGGDPKSGEIVDGGKEPQTVQAIKNIQACLESAGSSLDKIVRRRIYIIDMAEFRKFDRIWAEHISEPLPVSTCVQIGALAKTGALVEIEVDAEA